MWADESDASWLGPWSGLTHCGQCHTLMDGVVCPRCQHDYTPKTELIVRIVNGKQRTFPSLIREGALSYTTHSLLALMQREWERPEIDIGNRSFVSGPGAPSQKLLIVILFWTLFEHHMDRFFAAALSSLPKNIKTDLLKKYATIGSRLDRLYKILFFFFFSADLEFLGFSSVYSHLINIQTNRNEFIHGNSQAIDDALVIAVVQNLPELQSAWLALYNHRCVGNPNAERVWEK